MFNKITEEIEISNVKVVELLCNSWHVLEDLMANFSNLHDALVPATPDEPQDINHIADINPLDDKVDQCEWSEYLKAIYPLTLEVECRAALALDGLKPDNELKTFLSWDEYDTGLCKGAPR